MKNIALYGAGNAAEIYIKNRKKIDDVTCFTTDGIGEFLGQKINPINQLRDKRFDLLVIASDYYLEMLKTLLSLEFPIDKIFIYEYESEQLQPAAEIYQEDDKNKVLFGFYDLAVNHPNFDIVNFLVRLEQERIMQKKAKLYVYIVPSGLSNSCSNKSFNRYDGNEDVKWRIERLVMASCALIRSCIGVSLLPSRLLPNQFELLTVYPHNYDIAQPRKAFAFIESIKMYHQGYPIDVLKAPSRASRYVKKYIAQKAQGKKVVTIIMREYEHEPKRNSNIQEWIQFLSWLDKDKYFPIIVRDTAKAFELFSNELDLYEHFAIAAIDIQFRLALYELAWLNLTVDTGPCALMIPSTTIAYINFKPMIDDYIGCRPEFAKQTHGICLGEQAVWRGHNQKYVWQAENFELIRDEFIKYEKLMDEL